MFPLILPLAVAGLPLSVEELEEEEVVNERDWRRKEPAETNAADEAGVGGAAILWACWSFVSRGCCCCCWRFLSSDDFLECWWWEDDRGGGIEGAGATSLAMRASMKVTKVKETLWAGE